MLKEKMGIGASFVEISTDQKDSLDQKLGGVKPAHCNRAGTEKSV